MNAANNNDSSGGDGGSNTSLTLTEDESSSTSEAAIFHNVSIQPNPANDRVELTGLPLDAMVTLVDLNGRTLLERSDMGIVGELDISALERGLYLLQIRLLNSDMATFRKLVVQ